MAALHHTVSHIHISSEQKQQKTEKKTNKKQALTRIPILLHPPGHTAPRRDLIRLRLQARAAGARAPGVHAALQRVALPPKHVVGVLSVPGRVARREHERLRAVGRPLGFVVEGCGVPDDLCRVRGLVGLVMVCKGWGADLEHDLGDLDWVGGGACAADAGACEGLGAGDGVGDVGLVVGRVEVLAVPAAAVCARQYLCCEISLLFRVTHVGYRMLDRMPEHGPVGRVSVSSFPSAHGAASSPLKLGPL